MYVQLNLIEDVSEMFVYKFPKTEKQLDFGRATRTR